MARREATSPVDVQSGDHPDPRRPCAPIRRTAAGELDGLFRFAMARLGHDRHMAEDAVQQAVLIAMAHRSPPAEASRQRAWLRGIVNNVIRREMRSMRRGREAVLRASRREPDGPRAAALDGGAVADDGRARMVRALYLAVTELDGADQDLFHAFYRAGRSQACIAAEFGTTPKGVEARLYRLRSRLRAALGHFGENPS